MIASQDFLFLLQDTIEKVDQALIERRSGVEGVGSTGQLERIQQELSQVKGQLLGGQLPPIENRWLESAYLVIDAWPANEPLGERICRLDFLYRHGLDLS